MMLLKFFFSGEKIHTQQLGQELNIRLGITHLWQLVRLAWDTPLSMFSWDSFVYVSPSSLYWKFYVYWRII